MSESEKKTSQKTLLKSVFPHFLLAGLVTGFVALLVPHDSLLAFNERLPAALLALLPLALATRARVPWKIEKWISSTIAVASMLLGGLYFAPWNMHQWIWFPYSPLWRSTVFSLALAFLWLLGGIWILKSIRRKQRQY